jgi:hypothetical protein
MVGHGLVKGLSICDPLMGSMKGFGIIPQAETLISVKNCNEVPVSKISIYKVCPLSDQISPKIPRVVPLVVTYNLKY